MIELLACYQDKEGRRLWLICSNSLSFGCDPAFFMGLPSDFAHFKQHNVALCEPLEIRQLLIYVDWHRQANSSAMAVSSACIAT